MQKEEKPETFDTDKKETPFIFDFEVETLTEDIQKAASWFFWIAGLSFLNSLVGYFKADMYFVVGLGITQVLDAIFAMLLEGSGLLILLPGLLVSGFFVYIGYRSRMYDKWAFVVGVVVYAFDALIYLYVADWLAVGFHIFALVMISRGFFKVFEYNKASKQLKEQTALQAIDSKTDAKGEGQERIG